MAPKREEITATFNSERFRFSNADGDTIIGSARTADGEVAIKGQADLDELQPGQTYRFYGRWAPYKNRRTGQTEQQFAFESFVREAPHGREGVVAYLKSAGEGLGLGAARCMKLWDLFGSDAVRMLREQPAEVAARLAAAGLKLQPGAAEKVAGNLRFEMALEACTLDLMDVLNGRGFPKATARLVTRQWGNRAANVIRRNPYQLMNFRGCGFKRCDALYLDLKHNPAAIRRQGLCAWYTLAKDSEGHTWFPVAIADRGIRESVASASLDLEAALRFARRLGATIEAKTNGANGPIVDQGSCRWIAEGAKGRNEQRLAQAIADALREGGEEDGVICRELAEFPGYFAKSNGTIWSSWTNGGKRQDELRECSPDTIKGGYLRVRLRVATQQYKHAQVSHLILAAFVGPRPVDAVACHYDGNPQNNKLRNLRWDSRKENEEDKKQHGTHQTGSRNPAAILTESEVLEIRSIYQNEEISTYKLAEMYSVDRTTICELLKRKTWSHI